MLLLNVMSVLHVLLPYYDALMGMASRLSWARHLLRSVVFDESLLAARLGALLVDESDLGRTALNNIVSTMTMQLEQSSADTPVAAQRRVVVSEPFHAV